MEATGWKSSRLAKGHREIKPCRRGICGPARFAVSPAETITPRQRLDRTLGLQEDPALIVALSPVLDDLLRQEPGIEQELTSIAERHIDRANGEDAIRAQLQGARRARLGNGLMSVLAPAILVLLPSTMLVGALHQMPPWEAGLKILQLARGVFSPELALGIAVPVFAACISLNNSLANSQRGHDDLQVEISHSDWRANFSRIMSVCAFASLIPAALGWLAVTSRASGGVATAATFTSVISVWVSVCAPQSLSGTDRAFRTRAALRDGFAAIKWCQRLDDAGIPGRYTGRRPPSSPERYHTLPVLGVFGILGALTAIALMLAYVMFGSLGTSRDISIPPARLFGAAVFSGAASALAAYSIVFVRSQQWTRSANSVDPRLGDTQLFEWVVLTMFPLMLLLVSLQGGFLFAAALSGIVVGPWTMRLVLGRSVKPQPARLIAFLAWPTWGRVNAALWRFVESSKHTAIRMITHERQIDCPAPH